MAKRIVVALGGNALGNTPEEQLDLVRHTAKTIVDLAQDGYEVIVGHGNGPQVGMINLAMEFSCTKGGNTPYMPFPECGAMSQGYIGYHLQQAIQQELKARGVDKECASIITQVVVDANDPGFAKPTKPVGSFYTKEEADKIAAEKGFTFVEDAGRGYRRVVASPKPKEIVELSAIKAMVDAGELVICCGGGGIPVVSEGQHLAGAAAVIDKDFAAALLAESMEADMLIILTAVEKVAIRYGQPDQEWLTDLSVEEAQKYADQGEFAPGSMLPKVQAAIQFASAKQGNEAMITLLEKAREALQGKTGTKITKK